MFEPFLPKMMNLPPENTFAENLVSSNETLDGAALVLLVIIKSAFHLIA